MLAEMVSIRAVLLDMDGTLVDSDASIRRAWRSVALECDLDPDDVIAACHGRLAADTVRQFLPDASAPKVADLARRQLARQYDDLDDVVRTPGCDELLVALVELDLKWAVVTSADRRLASARLQRCRITAPVLVTADDVSLGKPAPEGYLLAAACLGVEPQACLVVEDAPSGIEAGHRAGAPVATLNGLQGEIEIADLGRLARLLRGSRS